MGDGREWRTSQSRRCVCDCEKVDMGADDVVGAVKKPGAKCRGRKACRSDWRRQMSGSPELELFQRSGGVKLSVKSEIMPEIAQSK